MNDDDPTQDELVDALAGMLVLAQVIGMPEGDLSFDLMDALRKRADRARELVARARGDKIGRYDRAALLAERDKLRAEVDRLRQETRSFEDER